jgi:hypothetical protein
MKPLLVIALAVVGLSAADATGTWTGTLTPAEREPGPAYVVLTQEGNALTGTAGPTADEQHPIHNGRAANGKLSFDVHTGGGVMRVTLEQQGDEMTGEATRERDGQIQHANVELKRAKPR